MKSRIIRKFKTGSGTKIKRFCLLLTLGLATLILGFGSFAFVAHAAEERCDYEQMDSPAIAFGDGKCVNEKYVCAKIPAAWKIPIPFVYAPAEITVKALYSCCVCEIPNEQPKKIGDSRYTRESCEEACKKLSPPGRAYKQTGAGAFDVAIKPTAPKTQAAREKLMMCFTEKVCTSKEYRGTFQAGGGCPEGQGNCIAPEPEVELSYPIGTVKTVRGFRGFVATIFQYILSIAATAAAVMFVWGGFRYIFGTAIGSIQRGKEIMIDASVGLLLVLGAYTILQTISPQTLTLKQLEVKMIKRQLFLSETSTCDLDTNYADAGEPPGTVDYDTASFDKGIQQTRCGYAYYPKDLGGEICMGKRCDDLGKVCVACEGGYKQCLGRTSGYACISSGFVGSIWVKNERNPKKIYLMAVCDGVQPPKDFEQVASNIPDYIEMDLTSSNTGLVGFSLPATQKELDKLKAKCDNKGGLRGFVLGVLYEDTSTLAGELIKNCIFKEAFGKGKAGTTLCLVGGIIPESVDIDDILIVTKKDCGGAWPYSGYVSGSRWHTDFKDMTVAFYCGYIHPPSVTGRNTVFNDSDSIYWRYEAISKAIAGQDKPATCTFQLNDISAPTDPSLLINYGWACTMKSMPE